MSKKVNIPSYLRPYTGDREVIEVEGNTVGECLRYLLNRFPNLEEMLFDRDQQLLGYVSIFVNGESAYPEDLTKSVADGDEIHIVFIALGG